MLYLVYTFEPTTHARTHPQEFWEWMRARVPWFYCDMPMVLDIAWRCEDFSDGRMLIHHEVSFAGERGMSEYRAVLAERGRDRAWERRRREQDCWYRIVERSIHASPPVSLALRPSTGATSYQQPADADAA